VLETWWLRLLPGVAAATHGVIRVGHAVRALTEDGEDPDHLTELAHGLAYWAARWQPVPGTVATGPPPVTARTAAGAGPAAEAGPRPPMGWLRSPGSPISRAAFANASPAWLSCRAGRLR
jgi:hypothetical protein